MGSLSLKAFDTVSKDIGDVKHEGIYYSKFNIPKWFLGHFYDLMKIYFRRVAHIYLSKIAI